ncbi:probable proline--tRNA ligase, mitochondrial isoform X2 [Prorops nasuta]
MKNIGAQKMLFPAFTKSTLWDTSNRYKESLGELFTVKDRHDKEYVLSPTYEEAICHLIADIGPLSKKELPLLLYQISSKWRDELRPRGGFLRSREFIMKDLYSFDSSLKEAQNSYDLVCKAYDNFFKQIGINFIKVVGDTGETGGTLSHEYHYLSNIGDDTILICPSCKYSINERISKDNKCVKCKCCMTKNKAVEVGHTFLLEDKYSKLFKAHFKDGCESKPLVMGCYGIGLSRILTTVVEIMSNREEIRWPKSLSPYDICIIPPKEGSKEEPAAEYLNKICEILQQKNLDIILDDRINMTIGRRLVSAQINGYPYVIIIGRTAMQSPPSFEVINMNTKQQSILPLEQMDHYFNKASNTNDKMESMIEQ